MLPLVIGHLIITGICIYIAAFLLTRKSAKETIYFIALCLYIAMYTFGNILLLMATNIEVAIMALKVENIGIPAVAPFFLLSVIQLCAPGLLRKWMGFAAILYSTCFTLIVLSNELHYLYYTSYDVAFGAWAQITLSKGPLYIVNQVIVIVFLALSYVVLIRRLFTWTSQMRRQMSLIFVGSLVTLVGNIVNVTGIMPGRIDVVVYACGITCILYFICILSNRLYDLVPLASELAIETMDDAMIVLKADGGYLYSNAAALRLFPELVNTITATPIDRVPGWPEPLRGRLGAGQMNVTIPVEGEVRHFRCVVSFIRKSNGDLLGWSVVMRDTSETVELMEQLQKLAVTDSLTGLYNRRHFVELVEHEQRTSVFKPKKMAMIMFDIDHFKAVNDTYGHAAGDVVLIAVSDAVQAVLRASDTLSRYGGEEFTILSTDTDIHGAGIFAERLRKVIEELKITWEGEVIQVRASFGVSEFDHGDNIDDAIEAADKAMYVAKTTGRNRVVLAKSLHPAEKADAPAGE